MYCYVDKTYSKNSANEILGASEITANLYCNSVHLHWEGCVICSIDLKHMNMKHIIGLRVLGY